MEIASLCKQDFITATDEIMLSDLFAKLRTYDKRAALIFRNKKYAGLVERKKLLQTNLDAHNTRVGKYVSPTPILTPSTSLIDAAKAFYDTNSDYLPIEKDKKIVGVVYARDLVAACVAKMKAVQSMKVDAIKLVKPAKIQSTNNLHDVINIMQEHYIDTVPIFEGNALIGTVEFRNLVRKYLNWSPKKDKSVRFNKDVRALTQSSSLEFANLALENFISKTNILKISVAMLLKDALKILAKQNVRDVIVVSNQKYLGLLTVRNILKTIAELKTQTLFQVRYVGLNKVNLTQHQEYAMRRIVENACSKLQRRIKEPFMVAVHLRDIRAKGKQKEFDVGLKVDVGGKIIATEKVDWDLETALHKCFAAVDKVKKK